ncbi:unnamed protein product [Arabis nemorensis]|uniref:RING-type domain-containing protein n=1 Tax=Arabis nemorensis TaxID=586526 RepID=A0A565BIK2_9BRAS|nr:unnamed protein product [Arabis nemorensis]
MNKDEEEMMEFDMETMGKLREICSCGICFNIFDEATVLNDYFHKFCRKCIYETIARGDFKCCPVCYNDAGPDPAKKLRRAHGWDNITDVFFKEQENEEMEQESTEGSEKESLVPSSIDMEDVKPLVPIKAEEDDKIELPSVSQNDAIARTAVKLEELKLERENDLMIVGSVTTSSAVERKAIALVMKEETQG